MKRSWASVLIAITVAISSLPSYGQMIGSATEITQLANKLMLAKQLVNQAEQIKDMLLNSKGFSTQIWSNAVGQINKLKSLMQQSKSLASIAGNLDGQFASKYGTYTSYLAQKMGSTDWKSKYEQWSQEGSDNALYTLKGVGLQASQLEDEESIMQELQGLASSADGRMQALQIANMMVAQSVDQIRKLRELIMMQIQMQANYLAIQQDQDAAEKAQRERLLKTWKDTPDNDGKGYGVLP